MTTKQILRALPEITSLKFRSNYAAHVASANPKVLRLKAWGMTKRNLWSAIGKVSGEISGEKDKFAAK